MYLVLSDHMLTIDWTAEGGWQAPKIEPFANFSVHPGAKVLICALSPLVSALPSGPALCPRAV